MRITITIIVLQCFLCLSSWAQLEKNSVIGINVDLGISNDSYDMFRYDSRTIMGFILVEERDPFPSLNYNFAYSYFFRDEHGIKLSFGQTTFGLKYSGKFETTGIETSGSMKYTTLEWGASYVHRFPLTARKYFIIEPGLRYHSDGSLTTDGLSFFRKDSFSFSGYVGVEMPIKSDYLLWNVGIQAKLPLESYNGNFSNQQPYYPYFVGVKFGVNFRFKGL